jgi:hypothetical protein
MRQNYGVQLLLQSLNCCHQIGRNITGGSIYHKHSSSNKEDIPIIVFFTKSRLIRTQDFLDVFFTVGRLNGKSTVGKIKSVAISLAPSGIDDVVFGADRQIELLLGFDIAHGYYRYLGGGDHIIVGADGQILLLPFAGIAHRIFRNFAGGFGAEINLVIFANCHSIAVHAFGTNEELGFGFGDRQRD